MSAATNRLKTITGRLLLALLASLVLAGCPPTQQATPPPTPLHFAVEMFVYDLEAAWVNNHPVAGQGPARGVAIGFTARVRNQGPTGEAVRVTMKSHGTTNPFLTSADWDTVDASSTHLTIVQRSPVQPDATVDISWTAFFRTPDDVVLDIVVNGVALLSHTRTNLPTSPPA